MDSQRSDCIQNLLSSFFRELEFGTMENLPIFINNFIIENRNDCSVQNGIHPIFRMLALRIVP